MGKRKYSLPQALHKATVIFQALAIIAATMATALPPLIDEATAALFESGHAAKLIGVAGVDRRGTLVHGYACRVAPDRRQITVTLGRSQADPVLQALAGTRRITLVACHIQSFKSLQVKGEDARLVDTSPADREATVAHCAEFARFAASLGYDAAVMRAHMDCAPEDVVTVAFTPAQAFVQTPGPSAGQPLAP
jgi:hypothetical protein